MAKELPYFKYFPSEWVTGDITLCTMESQGLFVNLCCYYWMKNCSMSLANAKQRFSKHEASIKELLDFDIIKLDENENIVINFLDKQMSEFIDVAEKRAVAGAKGGKAKAKQLLSKPKAKSSNKDKDKDKDKDNILFDDFWNLYNKKVGSKDKCFAKWNKLKESDRIKIMETLPNWLKQFKDKQFQPYPLTYLNNDRWNDEINSNNDSVLSEILNS